MNAINIKGFPEDITIEKIQDMESQFSSLPNQSQDGSKSNDRVYLKPAPSGELAKAPDTHHHNHTQKDVPTRETGKNSSAEHFLPLLTPDGCGFKFTYQKGEKNFAEKLVEEVKGGNKK